MSVSKADMQPKIGTASQYLLVFLVCVLALPCDLCFPNKRLWSRLLEPCNLELVFFLKSGKLHRCRERERGVDVSDSFSHMHLAQRKTAMALKVDQVASAACNTMQRHAWNRDGRSTVLWFFTKLLVKGTYIPDPSYPPILSLEPREPACNPGWNFKASNYQCVVGIWIFKEP
jgi:hypothetical protein